MIQPKISKIKKLCKTRDIRGANLWQVGDPHFPRMTETLIILLTKMDKLFVSGCFLTSYEFSCPMAIVAVAPLGVPEYHDQRTSSSMYCRFFTYFDYNCSTRYCTSLPKRHAKVSPGRKSPGGAPSSIVSAMARDKGRLYGRYWSAALSVARNL
mgnify:CR=1 FL=1